MLFEGISMRFTTLVGAFVVGLTIAIAPLSAHHGWGGQGEDNFTLSGKVHTGVSLAGPHATMKVVDDKGQVWDITLAPSARTDRAGLKEGVIPVGAPVTIVGKRNRDAKRFEVKTMRVTHAGKNYDVYPDRL
jgi:hypothetical protein